MSMRITKTQAREYVRTYVDTNELRGLAEDLGNRVARRELVTVARRLRSRQDWVDLRSSGTVLMEYIQKYVSEREDFFFLLERDPTFRPFDRVYVRGSEGRWVAGGVTNVRATGFVVTTAGKTRVDVQADDIRPRTLPPDPGVEAALVGFLHIINAMAEARKASVPRTGVIKST